MSTKTKLPWVAGLMMLALTSFGAWAGAPRITAISPVTGPLAGGSVVISTTNFSNIGGTTTVTFGGIPGVITNIAGTTITVTSPPHASGIVPVVVTDTVLPASTATRNNGYTYTNASLQITVTVNIPTIVSIQWGVATDIDDNGVDHKVAPDRVSAYNWVVNYDGRTTTYTQFSTSYTSNTTEGRVFDIENLSANNGVKISASATNPVGGAGWTLVDGVPPAANKAKINAKLGTVADANAPADLEEAPAVPAKDLTVTTPIPASGTRSLVLIYTTPSSAAASTLNTNMVSTIALTGSVP